METKLLAEAFFKIPEAAALPLPGKSGRLCALITGLSAVHRAHFCAALRAKTGRPLVILSPDETSAEAVAADIYAFIGERASILTGRDYVFIQADAASRQLEQRRLGALRELKQGTGVAILTAQGLFQRAMPPSSFERTAFDIDMKAQMPPEDLEDALIRCGYSRSAQVEGPGQFSRRGGILDFFSPAHEQPVRIEFWGDEIDSMAHFDIMSQRRTESLEMCTVLPAAETLPGLSRGGAAALAETLKSRAARLEKKGGVQKQLVDSLLEDAERLENGAELRAADKYAELIYGDPACAVDYIDSSAVVVCEQPGRFMERARDYIKSIQEDISALNSSGRMQAKAEDFHVSEQSVWQKLSERCVYFADAFTAGRYPLEPESIIQIQAKQLPSYGGSAEQAKEDLAHYREAGCGVLVLAGDSRRANILCGMFRQTGGAMLMEKLKRLPEPRECIVTTGGLSSGIEYPALRLAVLTDTQLMSAGLRRQKRRKKAVGEKISSCADLAVGDLVVHEQHGIGRFAGVVRMPVDGAEKDYMKISYAGTDSLYVPATQLDLVTKYVGAGEDTPVRLSKLGGAEWQRTKSRAKAAAKQLAKGLIQLYAERARTEGHAFAPDSPWQLEFEERFGYEETEDQLRCVEEIKRDMEKPMPMDRLLCGDVGYGKTEVALRAVMKCILDGCQAAILVPTTVLAQQHYQTAMQRFFGYPVNIEVLSRFRTPAQVRQTLKDLKSGKCDLVIGTHRLLQKDIEFKKLGLLIVDEEQRFGVSHKEHIKELARQVDVLTLSATPIPRTLNMALAGIRDMSTIEEPPQDRLPVQTFVMEHDWGVLAEAMRRELARGGQVYYLHNRVDNIERTALKISELLDGASVAVAHGKMDEEQLSRVMEDMVEGRVQVLVCTTIIETGIDIPNVNTLIIEDADKLGLAQLHQIRGRVGRSTRRASAYLTFKRDKVLTEISVKRLERIT